MDTPKRHVSWVENFPPDIWSYFSWYLPGEQLERLLMTGATLLRQRLTFPHTVKSIKLGEDFMIFKSLTRLFKDFPYVEELYFHSLVYRWSDKLGITIDSMPFGLRKLEFSGTWKKTADKLFDKDGTALKLNEHLPHLEVLDLGCLSCSNFSWMTHSPQSLTKLSLRRWDGNVELPTSLIHFTADEVALSSSSFVSELPPSLETFDVKDLKGAALLIPLLPASTRKLRLDDSSMTYGPVTSGKLLEQLPKSVAWLSLVTTEFCLETNPELVSHLPSTLTELRIWSFLPCSVWRLLPQQLTKLSSIRANQSCSTVPSKTVQDRRGVHHEVDSIPFDYLPRSITSLKLVASPDIFCGPPTTSDGSYFPPQLTHLDISRVQLSPVTAKLLPSSLTFLKIGNLCPRICENLPNTIKTLVSSSALLTPNLIEFLPKSLTSLQITVARHLNWFDYNTGQALDSVEDHPQHSKQVACMSPHFAWKDHSPLPSTLTELRIEFAYRLGDTFFQHQQLPNLTELDLESAKHFTDLSIHCLPQHLTYLNLSRSSKVSGKSFKFLPRGLTFLDLSASESIFDCDIEHLPRTLKHVYLRCAKQLTDICIPDLPPRLERLYMRENSQISTSCFPKLPYTLRSTQPYVSVEFEKWKVDSGVCRSQEDSMKGYLEHSKANARMRPPPKRYRRANHQPSK